MRKCNKLVILALAATGVCAMPAFGNTYTWSGATDGNWTTQTNWNPNGLPGIGDTVQFIGASHDSISLNGNQSTAGITFTDANSFTLSNNTLFLAAGGSIGKSGSNTALDTIASAIALAGDATFNNSADGGSSTITLDLTGPITSLPGSTIHITGGSSSAAVQLSGVNTSLLGNISVDSGALAINNNSALGSATVTFNAGTTATFKGGANTSNAFVIAGNASQTSFSGNAQSGGITINTGATWTVTNGGGNGFNLTGAITGGGNLAMTYGGTTLGGSVSNSLAGTTSLSASSTGVSNGFDTLTLNKTGGAIAIAGPLAVSNAGIVLWQNNNQIASTSPITLSGGTLIPNGFSNTLGTLTLNGSAAIDMSTAQASGLTNNVNSPTSALRFADSSALASSWTAGSQLLVDNWTNNTLTVGTSASGLTAAQVNEIGFVNPAGFSAGLYHATIAASGQLSPTGAPVTATHPLWDMSASAVAARTAVYNVPGLSDLSGASTPLTANMKISFFGDSITWLNGYIPKISAALASGTGSKNLNVQLFNHGINGGGVQQILNGSTGAGFDGGSNNAAQAPFASVIATDHSNVAVVFIGVNDVDGVQSTNATQFQTSLTSIVNQGKAAGVKMVICSVELHGELPDGQNQFDIATAGANSMDSFEQIAKSVASSNGAFFVDLRAAAMDYEENNNYTLNLDGSLNYQASGILTYDGIHPTDTGNTFLANQIAEGIFQAVPEPGSLSLLAVSAGLLLKRRRRA